MLADAIALMQIALAAVVASFFVGYGLNRLFGGDW